MRGRPNNGYRRSQKMQDIEAEYQMSFHEVLAGFAADGCNQSMTAAILDYDRGSFYRKIKSLERVGITIGWPCPYKTRAKYDYPNTPAQQAASLRNLQQRDPANAKPWGNEVKLTEAVVQQAAQLRAEHQLTWPQVAHRLGVAVSSLFRAREKYGVADPLGDVLVKQARRKFTESRV